MSRGRATREDAAPERPSTVQQALAAAGSHARNALAEALLAARSLLHAAALAAGSDPNESRLAALLDAAAEAAAGRGSPAERSLLEGVAEALEAEIGRWERRAQDDPDARAVLRAFLGLRELLWEFGVRPGRRPPGRRGPASRPSAARVQRVPVEG